MRERHRTLGLHPWAPLAAALLLAALAAPPALADGTETLGPPTLSIASGSGIATGGIGLADGQPGNISVDVPAGATVEQVLLYWEGANRESTDTTPAQSIEVNGSHVSGDLIGGDTAYAEGYRTATYRAEITTLNAVGPGSNTLSVGGLDFTRENDGAAVVVIYDDGTSAEVEVRDGNDYAHIRRGGTLLVTVPQTFSFAPASVARTARIDLLVGSVADDKGFLGFRPSSIEVRVGTVVTTFSDQLNSQNGRFIDVLRLEIEVPALETSLTVQLFSRDDDADWSCEEVDNCPASLVWTAAALAIREGGGEGCSPDYWRQRYHFGSWPNPPSPETPFAEVFENAFPGATLLRALTQRGGGLNALGRETVAAFANAASPDVDYDLIPQQVVDLFNGVYPGDRDAYNNLKSMFQGFNQQVCPLNGGDREERVPRHRTRRIRNR